MLGFGNGISGWESSLLIAAGVTVAVSACGFTIGLCLGSLLAWAKLASSGIVRATATAYVTTFRGIPELVIILLLYFGGTSAITSAGRLLGMNGVFVLPVFATGAFAIGLISAAYQAEIFRGAFRAIRPGEIEAARAVGMSTSLMFRRIVAPQVLRIALPGLGNVWQVILKESALLSVIGLVELLRQAQVGAGSTRRPFDFYAAAGLLYFLTAIASGYLFKLLEQRAARGHAKIEP